MSEQIAICKPDKAFLLLQLLKGGITDPEDLSRIVGVPAKQIASSHERDLRITSETRKRLSDAYPTAPVLKEPVRCRNCGGLLRILPCILCRNQPPNYKMVKNAQSPRRSSESRARSAARASGANATTTRRHSTA